MFHGLFVLRLDQAIASKKELGDITTIVVSQVEFSAWVYPLIAVKVKYKVVEYHKLLTSLDPYVDPIWRE